jgi:hypothetical protein
LKKNILFWFDSNFVNFGIAKYLKDNIDCNMFAVIDLHDKPKEFFYKQTIINFKKIWDIKPKIDKTKINLEYLRDIEEKFKINLWEIAFSERVFYKYNKYYNYSDYEILSILEQECRLFEKILDECKPDILCIKLTDWHDGNLLKEMAKSRGIKILMLTMTKFKGLCSVQDDLDNFKFIKFSPVQEDNKKSFKELMEFLERNSKSKSVKHRINSANVYERKKIFSWIKDFVVLGNLKKFNDSYKFQGQNRRKLVIGGISHMFKKKSAEQYFEKNSLKSIPSDQKFIYFPLHYEPERTLLIGAPMYTNQINVIENIAKSIPIGYKLFVKEHPTMILYGWRNTNFYKKIQELPNVELIYHSLSNYDIMKKSSLIISITGSSSLEASFFEKPSITLIKSSSNYIPTILHVENLNELSSKIKIALKQKVESKYLSSYLSGLEKETFEIDFHSLVSEFNKIFYKGGVVINTEIPIERMNKFLKDHVSDFNILGSEHLKKINYK